jgi:quinol monooxygenase YgiN
VSSQIVIAGWIDYEASERADVLAQFAEVARESREETGCLDYAVSPDPDDQQRIRVLEHWVSEEALQAHFATPHVQRFRSAVADRKRVGRSLQKHQVASSEPMQSGSVR